MLYTCIAYCVYVLWHVCVHMQQALHACVLCTGTLRPAARVYVYDVCFESQNTVY